MLATAGTACAAGALGWWGWERRHRRTRAMPAGLHEAIALPHAQEFELYHNALSLCSKKVRLCLAELAIPYASHHVDLIETGAYENVGRRFLAVNPAGLVPVLVHRGHPVYESHAQIRYAAEYAPGGAPRLVPADAVLAATMERWVDRTSLVGDDPLAAMAASAGNAVPGLTVPLFAAMLEDVPVRRILEGLLFHRLKARPLAFLLLKQRGLRRLATLTPAIRVIRRALRHMADHLDALEAQLASSGGPWLLGATFSLADVSWLPILERLAEADVADVLVDERGRPRVRAYWQRLRGRPSHAAAIRAHAHPAVARGTARLREAKAADAALRDVLESPEPRRLVPRRPRR